MRIGSIQGSCLSFRGFVVDRGWWGAFGQFFGLVFGGPLGLGGVVVERFVKVDGAAWHIARRGGRGVVVELLTAGSFGGEPASWLVRVRRGFVDPATPGEFNAFAVGRYPAFGLVGCFRYAGLGGHLGCPNGSPLSHL